MHYWMNALSRTLLRRNYNVRFARLISHITKPIKISSCSSFISKHAQCREKCTGRYVFYMGRRCLLSVTSDQNFGSWGPIRNLTVDSVRRQNHDNPQGKNDRKRGLRLMEFPEIVWPNLLYTIKLWILSKLVVQPFLDPDFNLDDFAKGSKQAFLYVSGELSGGNFNAMEGLVTDEAIDEIRSNYERLSIQERTQLALCSEDIYFSFPYQLGVMLEDTESVQKRFVEITVCFHCLQGIEAIKQTDPMLKTLANYKDKIIICNCRFIKEFTRGRESDWTMNVINYFKPAT